MKNYFVYILTNKTGTVLYIGVTNNLERRLYEHQNKLFAGFTAKYNLTRLVHYEQTGDATAAIAREKQLKGWTRAKKIALINGSNPKWQDLASEWRELRDPSLRSG